MHGQNHIKKGLKIFGTEIPLNKLSVNLWIIGYYPRDYTVS